MGKIVYAQTVIELEKLEKLKQKSGEGDTKEALMAAIDHYIACQEVKK